MNRPPNADAAWCPAMHIPFLAIAFVVLAHCPNAYAEVSDKVGDVTGDTWFETMLLAIASFGMACWRPRAALTVYPLVAFQVVRLLDFFIDPVGRAYIVEAGWGVVYSCTAAGAISVVAPFLAYALMRRLAGRGQPPRASHPR